MTHWMNKRPMPTQTIGRPVAPSSWRARQRPGLKLVCAVPAQALVMAKMEAK